MCTLAGTGGAIISGDSIDDIFQRHPAARRIALLYMGPLVGTRGLPIVLAPDPTDTAADGLHHR